MRRGSRRSAIGLARAGLLVALALRAPRALAEPPCERAEVKGFIAEPLWPKAVRPAAPPAWQTCAGSVDEVKAAVLRAYAGLRARPVGARDPSEAEKLLLRGSDRTVSRDVLPGWRGLLLVPNTDGRFDNLAYEALLGSLAQMILDRASCLEPLNVGAVQTLQEAVHGKPDWRKVERSLEPFQGLPLWGAPGETPTLAGLCDLAAGITPSVLRTPQGAALLDGVRRLPQGSAYFPRLAKLIGGFGARPAEPPRTAEAPRPEAARPETPRGTPAPGPAAAVGGVWVVRGLPPGCATPLCKAAERCGNSARPELWASLTREFDAALQSLRASRDAARAALPGAVRWETVGSRIEALASLARRLAADRPYATPSEEVGRGVREITEVAARLRALDAAVVYRQAMSSLLRGDVARARTALESSGDAWKRTPRLAAARVATAYWEKGSAGARDACGATADRCAGDDIGRELRTAESILGLAAGALGP